MSQRRALPTPRVALLLSLFAFLALHVLPGASGLADEFAAVRAGQIGTGANTVRAPSAPRVVKLSNVTNTTVKVAWLPPQFDGGSPIVAYTVIVKHALLNIVKTWPTTNTYVTVGGLRISTQYIITVRAKNRVEVGQQSAPVNVTTGGQTNAVPYNGQVFATTTAVQDYYVESAESIGTSP